MVFPSKSHTSSTAVGEAAFSPGHGPERNSPKSDSRPDSYPRRFADLPERNYAMIHRLQLSHAVLAAEVQLLRDLLFEAIAEPATAARARTIYGERIATLRQDVMIQLEGSFRA